MTRARERSNLSPKEKQIVDRILTGNDGKGPVHLTDRATGQRVRVELRADDHRVEPNEIAVITTD